MQRLCVSARTSRHFTPFCRVGALPRTWRVDIQNFVAEPTSPSTSSKGQRYATDTQHRTDHRAARRHLDLDRAAAPQFYRRDLSHRNWINRSVRRQQYPFLSPEENSNVTRHNPVDRPGAHARRCISRVAAQQRMGLRSEQRSRHRRTYPRGASRDGPDLAALRATHAQQARMSRLLIRMTSAFVCAIMLHVAVLRRWRTSRLSVGAKGDG